MAGELKRRHNANKSGSVKRMARIPSKFCRVCEITFDPQLLQVGETPRPGFCPKCQELIDSDHAAVKLEADGIPHRFAWVKKGVHRADWPDVTVIKNPKVMQAVEEKITKSQHQGNDDAAQPEGQDQSGD